MVSETSKTCATGTNHEDDTCDPSRFSRKPRESRANNEIRFTKNARSGNFETNRHKKCELKMRTKSVRIHFNGRYRNPLRTPHPDRDRAFVHRDPAYHNFNGFSIF